MELSDLKGLGPARLNHLRAMGITSLRDLLFFFPVRYEDHIHSIPLDRAWEGDVLVEGTISEEPRISYFRGISRVSAVLKDQNQSLPVCWFNEPWMTHQISGGQAVALYGRIQVKNGRRTLLNPKLVSERRWNPVYRTVRGIPARFIQQLMREALGQLETCCPETLPQSFRQRYNLISRKDAIDAVHFPESREQILQAKRRLDFENALMYLMSVAEFRNQRPRGWPMNIPAEDPDLFWSKMPFTPTEAQKRVLQEIASDLRGDCAMSRLVQGDVGCGKTAIAFGAIWLVCRQGFQAAMMAPTEILARQHYENARPWMEKEGITCELLTGSVRAAQRRKILKELADGSCQVVFGTHALISEGVNYSHLGLVITDEQHRFGVRQRSALQEKSSGEQAQSAHVLVMSATPIPRTLALILYGDLDLSVVDELPAGRIPVKTRLVPAEKRSGMYAFLRKQIAEGRQAYVVCPLVEDSESLQDVKSAQTLFEELISGELRGLRVGKVYGTQKADEKNETLHQFAAGELDVLVATTVIEVGVNVPNATVIVIENAERYGLSQLHQLRGRVGRGSDESWCFLLSGAGQKLKILCETNDGFLVAQKDLEMRGPGDLMGTRQSGDAMLQLTGGGDVRLLDEVQACVRDLLSDPSRAGECRQIAELAHRYIQDRNLQVALN